MTGKTPHPDADTEWWNDTHNKAAATVAADPQMTETVARLLANYRSASSKLEAIVFRFFIEDKFQRCVGRREKR